MNPIANLLKSRKALVTLLITGICFAALFTGKAQWHEITDLLKFVLPGWLLAQGIEDAGKKWKDSNSETPTAVPVKKNEEPTVTVKKDDEETPTP